MAVAMKQLGTRKRQMGLLSGFASHAPGQPPGVTPFRMPAAMLET
jgi:hypothetical protein